MGLYAPTHEERHEYMLKKGAALPVLTRRRHLRFSKQRILMPSMQWTDGIEVRKPRRLNLWMLHLSLVHRDASTSFWVKPLPTELPTESQLQTK